MANYLQVHGGAPLDHPRRCTAHRQDGKPCRRYAISGGHVCRVHGGGAPQVIAKARERLALAADRMARELLGIAEGAESESVKLAAIRDALDRAGITAKQAVELSAAQEPKPYELMFSGIAKITRAQHEAKMAALRNGGFVQAAREFNVVDAEVVPPQEAHAYRPSDAVDGAERTDQADAPADESAASTVLVPPPPPSLNQEEAAALMRESLVRNSAVPRKVRKRHVRRFR